MVVLAEQGSYRLAADTLFITQPALTKQIQMLERQLGLSVFVRGRHGASMTAAGQRLYMQARELVAQYDAFLLHAGRVAEGSTGELALGFGISFFSIAPQIITQFRERFPEVNIRLNDMPSEQQCLDIRSGKLNAGFVRLPVATPLESVALFTETLVLAVPSALHSAPDEADKLLEHFPLLQISAARGKGLVTQIARFISSRNITPKSIHYSDDIHTLLALVAAGHGCALVPQGALHITPPEVRLIPLDSPDTRWQAGLAWNGDISDTLRNNFIEMAIRWAKVS